MGIGAACNVLGYLVLWAAASGWGPYLRGPVRDSSFSCAQQRLPMRLPCMPACARRLATRAPGRELALLTQPGLRACMCRNPSTAQMRSCARSQPPPATV